MQPSEKRLIREIGKLKSELMHTQKQLIEMQDKFASSKLYEEFYEERYQYYMQQCVELEREIKELKTENKKQKLAIMAFKSVWNAHVNRKEAQNVTFSYRQQH